MTTFKSTFLANITLFYYVIEKSIKIYCQKNLRLWLLYLSMAITRGGVENTRLKTIAKETKKNLRPRTDFSRTDPIEAKYRNARGQGCRSLLSIWGDILQFYPNFAVSLTLGGWISTNGDDFFQMSKWSKDQKKDLHQKWNTFFPQI